MGQSRLSSPEEPTPLEAATVPFAGCYLGVRKGAVAALNQPLHPDGLRTARVFSLRGLLSGGRVTPELLCKSFIWWGCRAGLGFLEAGYQRL
jgi:hypothetical protein